VLAADGGVLALGDLTFMSEPYDALYDNDRWIANVADFVSGAQREYDLSDFPYFFAAQTDLVFVGGPLWDSDLLKGGSALQGLFGDAGKELVVRRAEDREADTLFLGLYEAAGEVEPYLDAAGVTLWMSPTGALEEEGTPVTSRKVMTTAVITPPLQNRIEIESVGQVIVTGTSLLLMPADDQRQTLVVLADTEEGLGNAVERLSNGDLSGCLFREPAPSPSLLALCPTGEVATGGGEGGWQEPGSESAPEETQPADNEPPPEPKVESGGSILVVALEHGEPRYTGLTSVDDYRVILSGEYDVTTWSTAQKGMPTVDDMLDYDLVIWTSGDFESPLSDGQSDTLFEVVLEGIPVVLYGAFIGETDTEAVQRDIQVHDASHPLAEGFEADQVIGFVTSPAGSDYEMGVLEGLDGDQGSAVPFVRGPDSEKAGAPAIIVMEDDFTEVRFVFVGFPLYLLPEEAKATLVLNMAHWLLNP